MKRLLLLLLLAPTPLLAQTATITWTGTHQTIQGFGASNAFVGTAMNSRDTFFFSTLGYSLLRSAVPISNGTCDGSPSSACAVGQDSITDMQSCVANGCSVWVYVSNPPGEYNSSGTYQCTVNPALIPADYGAFATYVTNYVASLKNFESVTPYAVSVQNEPDFSGGCQMSAAQMDTFIKTNLGPTMSSAGQSGTLIMMPESSHYSSFSSWAATCMNDSSCKPFVGVLAFHDYDNASTITNPYSITQFWETEVSANPSVGPNAPGCSGGQWCPTMADALMWAGIVDNNLTQGVSAWSYFWYVDPNSENTNSALVNPSQGTPVSLRTYAIAQWAKFVRPGYVRIDATHVPVAGTLVTAFKDPTATNKFAIVVVNNNTSDTNVTFNLSGFPTVTTVNPTVTDVVHGSFVTLSPATVTSNSFTYPVPKSSVITFTGTAAPGSNTCPTAANYLNAATDTLTTLTALGITKCYFIAANGNDASDGGSESTPWAHAPQMPACANNCATLQNTGNGIPPGTGLIFKGGDTWHLGDNTQIPYTGGTWNFNTGKTPDGTAVNPIYLGWDKSWFTGGSWTRPILNGDNPICNLSTLSATCIQNPGTTPITPQLTWVTSCPYNLGTQNDIIQLTSRSYYIEDGFEMLGLCQGVVGNSMQDSYINYGSANGNVFINNYAHGWTHKQFNANNDCSNPSTSTSVCFHASIFAGSGTPGETIAYNVVDGSDSDPAGNGLDFPGFYNTYKNVFRWLGQGIYRDLHVFHDNLMEHWYSPGDANAHGNLLESDGEFQGQPSAIYNNLFREVCTDFLIPSIDPCPPSISGIVVQNAPAGLTQYIFNNVIYDYQHAQYIGMGGVVAQGAKVFFNNSFQENGPGGLIYGCTTTFIPTFTLINDFYSADGTIVAGACVPGETAPPLTELPLTNSAATAAGYTNAQTFAFSPTTSSSPTVGTGTNEQSICTAMLGSSDALIQKAGTACKSDTTYGPAYNSTTHTVTGLARTPTLRPTSNPWDIGAYQFSAGGGTPAVGFFPTSLDLGVILTTQTSAPQTVTVTNVGTATLTYTAVTTTNPANTTFAISGGTCGSSGSLAVNTSCTVQVTFSTTVVGVQNGTLNLFSNAAGSPQQVPLMGSVISQPIPATSLSAMVR
jgi:O-glycosyl hydrolase